MNTADDLQLLPILTVCRTLGIGREAVNALIKSGDLEAIRIGQRWRVPVRSLDNFIRKQHIYQA